MVPKCKTYLNFYRKVIQFEGYVRLSFSADMDIYWEKRNIFDMYFVSGVS